MKLHRSRTAAVTTALITLALTPASGASAASRLTPATITQPPPPITASSFPIEPQGTAPADNDGLIPNPQTPTGAPIGPPASCTVTFASSSGSTSADVNA